MESTRRRLLWSGMFLFFLGLITGFFETQFSNPRMGLSAHLQGVMNGIFLLALGAIWTEVKLIGLPKHVAYWSVLYGTYVNWGNTVLAAIFGTGTNAPITAPGRLAQPWQENLVTAVDMSGGLAIITATILVLWGLRIRAVS